MSRRLAVIWDMDGVLVDTGEFHYKAWKTVLNEYKKNFSYETFRITFGMNNTSMLAMLFPEENQKGVPSDIGDRKEAIFRDLILGKLSLIPGVGSWLEYFYRKGMLQAVASSAPKANIDLILHELDIQKYFSSILSAENMPGKPHPAVFLRAANEMGIEPDHCIVIEDSLPGVVAAKRAGMKCVAVTNTNPYDQLQQADMIVDLLGPDEFRLLEETIL